MAKLSTSENQNINKEHSKNFSMIPLENCIHYTFIFTFSYVFVLSFCTQLNIKYSDLIQIICTQLSGFKYFYLIQVICTQLSGFKYSYLIQIICTQLSGFKYSYLIQIICTQLSGFKYTYRIQIIYT